MKCAIIKGVRNVCFRVKHKRINKQKTSCYAKMSVSTRSPRLQVRMRISAHAHLRIAWCAKSIPSDMLKFKHSFKPACQSHKSKQKNLTKMSKTRRWSVNESHGYDHLRHFYNRHVFYKWWCRQLTGSLSLSEKSKNSSSFLFFPLEPIQNEISNTYVVGLSKEFHHDLFHCQNAYFTAKTNIISARVCIGGLLWRPFKGNTYLF